MLRQEKITVIGPYILEISCQLLKSTSEVDVCNLTAYFDIVG